MAFSKQGKAKQNMKKNNSVIYHISGLMKF